ncbi:VWA domain-containing protein [Tessaracoccus massiliensis]|uniref:VWA domain-containing protein n=1 Tax=Tessaracoccus massiliensis TaxID=1522311 RepID=UPI0006933E74|nr:vWA domain-containing protein [Tessaracoccus massiliensis]
MIWLRLLTALLLAASVVAPRLSEPDAPAPPTGADVLFLVDRTTSMGAQDHQGQRPRMEGVADDIAAIVEALPNARYTVVTADNDARIAAPWTTDTTAIVTLGRTMGWREEGFGTGSDIAVGAPLAEELLRASAAARPDVTRYLFYFGDGEQIAPHEPASFASLVDVIDGAWVLGYGTAEGGVMALRVDSDELVTRDGTAQLSRLDEARLQTIAEQLGGTYLHRTAPGGLSLPTTPRSTVGEASTESLGLPLGMLLAGAAALALAIDVVLTSRAARRLRAEVLS